MTNRSQWAVALAAAAALGVTACNNDSLTGYNDNPNSATTAPAPALFTNATRVAVARWLGTAYDLRGTEFVAQHLAEVQYPDEDAYKRLQGGFTAATFDNAYAVELQDFQKVVDAGKAANNHLIYGPALVMRTWGFGYLTDTWGDIPYFGALKGDSAGGTVGATLAPTYDKQQLIYADFFKVLAQATTDLGKPAGPELAGLDKADVIYGGDTEAWQRFSNSLRLRFAMRIVNVDPATAKTQFEAAVAAAGGLITSNDEAPKFKWPGDGVYDNPWANNFKTRDDHRLSNRLTSIMGTTNDPRLPVYGMPVKTGGFAGLENALTQDAASAFLTTTSRPGAIFYPGTTTYGTFGGGGASLPQYLMTYAEVEFLLAEGAQRGWNAGGGTAASHYLAGINASMDQWGVANGTARATYLARPDVAYQGGNAGLIQIATQKWLALYGDGGQAWAEWRRTCQPANVVPGPEAITDIVPRRFQYSTTETEVNAEGIATAIANQGPDEFETRMWWDKSPTVAPTYPGASCGVKP